MGAAALRVVQNGKANGMLASRQTRDLHACQQRFQGSSIVTECGSPETSPSLRHRFAQMVPATFTLETQNLVDHGLFGVAWPLVSSEDLVQWNRQVFHFSAFAFQLGVHSSWTGSLCVPEREYTADNAAQLSFMLASGPPGSIWKQSTHKTLQNL